jgi:hypothetical protein
MLKKLAGSCLKRSGFNSSRNCGFASDHGGNELGDHHDIEAPLVKDQM